MTDRVATLLAGLSLSLASCASTKLITSNEAACSIATARVMAERRAGTENVAFCDHVEAAGSPPGYFLLALRGHCREAEGCGSTNMGWFAVEGATGAVFEWDVGEDMLGRRVHAGRSDR